MANDMVESEDEQLDHNEQNLFYNNERVVEDIDFDKNDFLLEEPSFDSQNMYFQKQRQVAFMDYTQNENSLNVIKNSLEDLQEQREQKTKQYLESKRSHKLTSKLKIESTNLSSNEANNYTTSPAHHFFFTANHGRTNMIIKNLKEKHAQKAKILQKQPFDKIYTTNYHDEAQTLSKFRTE